MQRANYTTINLSLVELSVAFAIYDFTALSSAEGSALSIIDGPSPTGHRPQAHGCRTTATPDILVQVRVLQYNIVPGTRYVVQYLYVKL